MTKFSDLLIQIGATNITMDLANLWGQTKLQALQGNPLGAADTIDAIKALLEQNGYPTGNINFGVGHPLPTILKIIPNDPVQIKSLKDNAVDCYDTGNFRQASHIFAAIRQQYALIA